MRDPQRSRQPGSSTDATPDDLTISRVVPQRAAPGLAAAMWLLAALVAAAVLKPWGGAGRALATLHPEAAGPVEVTPAPTEDRSATGLALPICLGTGAWRVASLETWRGRDVRVWRAIEPVDHIADLGDPSIPSVPIVADVLSGLGFCAPAYGDEQPIGPAHLTAWQLLTPTVATRISLRQVQPVDGATPIAGLYIPRFGAWMSGRVVFEYDDVGASTSRWFAVDLQLPAPSPGAASPEPSAERSSEPSAVRSREP